MILNQKWIKEESDLCWAELFTVLIKSLECWVTRKKTNQTWQWTRASNETERRTCLRRLKLVCFKWVTVAAFWQQFQPCFGLIFMDVSWIFMDILGLGFGLVFIIFWLFSQLIICWKNSCFQLLLELKMEGKSIKFWWLMRYF